MMDRIFMKEIFNMNIEERYKDMLIKSEIDFEVTEVEQGKVYKFVNEREDGLKVLLGAVFNNDNRDVDLQIHSSLGILNPGKRNEILGIMNKLNNSYRYGKLILLDDSQIIMKDSIALLDENFDYSQTIFQTLLLLYKVAEECFPSFYEYRIEQ